MESEAASPAEMCDESDQDSDDSSARATARATTSELEKRDESLNGGASESIEIESDIAANVEVTSGTETLPASHWNEIVAGNIKEYLVHGNYPSDLPSSESVKRRNFRKRAKDFVVKNDRLYYVDKKDGSLRIAIYSKEEQERVFHVRF